MINNAATSFGGAFTSFAGSSLAFTQSEFSDNVSGFYGGGLLALYGNASVTFSKINRNRYGTFCQAAPLHRVLVVFLLPSCLIVA